MSVLTLWPSSCGVACMACAMAGCCWSAGAVEDEAAASADIGNGLAKVGGVIAELGESGTSCTCGAFASGVT